MYYFWSKCEWETIIEIVEDRVYIKPFVGCKDYESAKIDVTNDNSSFGWLEFAQTHIKHQNYGNRAKIDVFDQLEWLWSEFVDYCWHTRLKYERDDPKFYV
jgi:hypothetical protein